jgi:FMN-dependent NADH-azoreductase
MTNLLIIETSARSSSISTALAHEFIEKLTLNTVELNLKNRNLNSDQLQNLDEEMTTALRSGVKNPTELQAKTIAQ